MTVCAQTSDAAGLTVDTTGPSGPSLTRAPRGLTVNTTGRYALRPLRRSLRLRDVAQECGRRQKGAFEQREHIFPPVDFDDVGWRPTLQRIDPEGACCYDSDIPAA